MNLGQPNSGPMATAGPSALGSGMPGQSQPQKPRRRVLTSLGFQIFIFFGSWWDVAYYILNILVFVYKGLQLPYPKRNFEMEFSFSWLWILIEVPRLFLASKGNKTEQAAPIIFSSILALPLLGMYVYFIAFQTYVLKIDQITNAISLIFMGIQMLFSVLVIIRFIMATRFA